jgi:hypothetical protein
VKDPNGLRVLWDVLESDGNFKYAFADAQKWTAPATAEEAMSQGLEAYFSRSSHELADLVSLRRRMVGKYILYRPAWRDGAPTGAFQTSLMEIRDVISAANVFETQDFAETDILGGYYQKDEGFLFCYGLYTFFLTAGTARNPSLKLWVVTQAMPPGDDKPIRWFQGKLYATGRWNAYDSVKFACLRVTTTPDPISAHSQLDDIVDQNIKSALSKS